MADTILDRFGWIVAALKKAVGHGGACGMTAFLMLRIQAEIGRIARLMPQAALRAAWPICPRPPSATPRGPRPAPPPLHPADAWRRFSLPRSEGWLIRKLPGLAHPYATYLQMLLAEPEMANLAATPRGGRLLRPLCRMLGITSSLPEPAPADAPPGSFVATPAAAALAVRLPPPPPPVSDPWATCAQPIMDLYPRHNLYRAT